MKLENQVVSLELAKQLKELGVKQESLFYWWISNKEEHKNHINFQPAIHYERPIPMKDKNWDWSIVSAFTVAELGEMLPLSIYTVKEEKDFYCWGSAENASYEKVMPKWAKALGGEDIEPIHAETEADARAAMLIWLVENGYLKEVK